MISYQEALQIILEHPFDLGVESVDILDASGRVLAEDIHADRDLPPYDRVTMDGIAINYEAYHQGQRTFEISETIGAGVPQKSFSTKTNCVQIMTGAIMPIGLDTVIRYEDISIEDGLATINEESVEKAQNIHFKGEDRKQGDVILNKGKMLGPAELIVAAAVGRAKLSVFRLPKAAIITTGDELVDIKDSPADHQIRRSSNYGIHSLLNNWGISVKQFHLIDDKKQLLNKLSSIIEGHDVIVITGGVSRGKFDFLPEVLEELGVEKHFHKVKQRPGKPFWFGTNQMGKTIFALPGNPVSSFVCALVYIHAWLTKSLNQKEQLATVRLGKSVTFDRPLTYFLECSVEANEKGERVAMPIKGNGSGDFDNMTLANGFLVLPAEKNECLAGEVYPYIPYRNSVS